MITNASERERLIEIIEPEPRGGVLAMLNPRRPVLAVTSLAVSLALIAVAAAHAPQPPRKTTPALAAPPSERLNVFDIANNQGAQRLIDEGRRIFRYDTFGSEAFWGDALGLHRAIAGTRLGGVGPGLSPKGALALGLKVDADALPPDLVQQLRQGQVNLDDPATTLALLRLNAVVGLTGRFTPEGAIRSVGMQCAICHSTVDNSFMKSIGRRLDGWPNRDLDVGKLILLAPNAKPLTDRLGIDEDALKKALTAWGPGKFDAELLQDGKAFRPDGKSAATLLPAAFGLAGVNNQTWTGWGSVTHWNAYVANTQMRGQGTFFDPRLNNSEKFPIAAKTGEWNIRKEPDLITAKLPALHVYQLTIAAPRPPEGSFNRAAATRGQSLFVGKAQCARCHVPPLFTEPGWPMHTADEIGIDDFQAKRSPDERYRTAPLKGLFAHMKGGFFHDGRFATLQEVIKHYDAHLKLGLAEAEMNDLAEYLKSL
jgi:hypothetical protein